MPKLAITWNLRKYLAHATGNSAVDGMGDDEIEKLVAKLLREGTIIQSELDSLTGSTVSPARAKAKAAFAAIAGDDDDYEARLRSLEPEDQLAIMWRKIEKKFEKSGTTFGDGSQSQRLMDMAYDHAKLTGEDVAYGASRDNEPVLRVKKATEQYSSVTRTIKHKKSGQHPRFDEPLLYQGNEIHTLSGQQHAMLGAWAKMSFGRQIGYELTDHEKNLLSCLAEKETFVVDQEKESSTKKYGSYKALLDDVTSGGQYAVPNWYDRLAVHAPIHSGDLMPDVHIRDVDRGSSFEGVRVGPVSLIEGTAEGTPLSLFTTTGMFGDIGGNFYPVSVAIEMGLDWASDAVIDVGEHIAQEISAKYAERFDYYVALGSTGSSQPEGVMNCSGTINITPSVPTSGPVTLADAIEMYFGIGPNYRKRAGARTVFCCNDTLYSRFRSIATGVTGDTRTVFGMDIGSYRLFEGQGATRVAIVQGMANDQMFHCDLSQYRWYRRQGVTMRYINSGITLGLKNTAVILARTRIGGKLVNGTAAAVATGFQI